MNHKNLIILRKTIQIIFFLIFILTIAVAVYPFKAYFFTKLFLIIDPLNAIGTQTATGRFNPIMLLSLPLLLSPILFGRAFCGWICPLGTTIDLTDNILNKKHIKTIKIRRVKYFLLILFLLLSTLGFQLFWLLDPLPIIWRSFAIIIFPIAYTLVYGFVELFINVGILPDFFSRVNEAISNTFFSPHPPTASGIFLPLVIFLLILSGSFISKRFWCKNLCPLGALLGIIARWSLLRRHVVTSQCTACSLCDQTCKMDAIYDDFTSTNTSECIICLNCTTTCPTYSTEFKFSPPTKVKQEANLTRRSLIFAGIISLLGAGFLKLTAKGKENDRLIRPPGAVTEEDFNDLCIRCGECIRVCSTSGGCLQPGITGMGIAGLMTPRADYHLGYCEYECNLCGQICPTEAIQKLKLKEKKRYKMGTAIIQKDRCIPYRLNDNCIVCEEHCPIPEKAIKLDEKKIFSSFYNSEIIVKYPYVIPELCIGCGICENKCPVEGEPGIIVIKEGEERIKI